MADFLQTFHESPFILTGAGVGERLKSEYGIKIKGPGRHIELLDTHRTVLETIYRQYMEVGRDFDLPLMLATPTRKINPDTTGSEEKTAYWIAEACTFLDKLRASYGSYSSKIFLAGHLGCRGDAYDSRNALSQEDSLSFHSKQVGVFQKTGVDLLFAGIMPAIDEATGMAMAMAASGLPYIISFMIRKDGCLIDGTSIADAIQRIDSIVSPSPLCYMTNCVHPSNTRLALTEGVNHGRKEMNRFLGLKANASSLSPEALEKSQSLQQEDFGIMVQEMEALQHIQGLKILGGCCGTDHHFLRLLANSSLSKMV